MRGAAVFVAAVLLSACAVSTGGAPQPAAPEPALATGDDAITVASFDFVESEILAEIYAQAFELHGVRVVRHLRLGPREFVEPALQGGLIEFVPEYSGSLLEFLTRRDTASADLAEVRRALEPELDDRGLVPLASAPAQDSNAFATTVSFASANRIATLSDLASLGEITLGGPAECASRPLCLPGLESTYGIRVGDFVALDLSGPLTHDALARGVVDVALVLTTSPILEGDDLLVLADDHRLQPAEHVTPVVHGSVIERFGPVVAEVADRVSDELTTEELRALNTAVELGGTSVADVATAWLDRNGISDARA